MQLFLITFGLFILVILGMSLGYIIKRKSITGSCGGISALGMEKMCDCEVPCDNLQAKLDVGDEKAQKEFEEKFTQKKSDFYEVK
ncbi:hypothetical protein EV697_105165 [Bisgaardia hudsonensis]|uniref:(Na+)-NQR maturation NqrM n=1 Tax=Bisgaardia hudsonensis TaxID=109472 RepID=A0A4R2MV70_9PAST|nr:(Na+)-NQR maturation NqrM [Bisgaardia hudsonensis]QLB13716.1 hypothetical protein A6A11_08880 [Bisgaardia hudsonensis]TCP12053.1 hypothetical protein EV697_105165 [Bisgaardia hudsonensis]